NNPSVINWSQALLGPLRDARHSTLRDTVRCWLRSNAQLSATSAALDVSIPGIRKRLVRVEQLIGRSLLGAPSARFDLFLAFRVQDPLAGRPHPAPAERTESAHR